MATNRVVPLSLPEPVIKRLRAIAPKAKDRSYLLRQFILEGLNRYELDCLWCGIKERENGESDGD